MTNLTNYGTNTLRPETLDFELNAAEKQVMVDITKMARSFSGPARTTLLKASGLISSATHMAQMQAMAIMVLAQEYGPKDSSAEDVQIPETIRKGILDQLTGPGAEAADPTSEPVAGLHPWQEPKYTTDGLRIINRASGEPIPLEEPIFILRGKDPYAALVISLYIDMLSNQEHRQAVIQVFTRFMQFRALYAQRMAAEPTTDLGLETK